MLLAALWTLLLFAGIYLALTLAIVRLVHLPKAPILHDVALAVPAIASLLIILAWHELKASQLHLVDRDVSASGGWTGHAES